MINTLVSEPFSTPAPIPRRTLAALLRALWATRREVIRISALARRERLQQGYRYVPRRVWDRRSALFIDG